MRRRSFVVALIAMLTVALVGFLPSASARSNGPLREYVVQYEAGAAVPTRIDNSAPDLVGFQGLVGVTEQGEVVPCAVDPSSPR